MSPNDDEGFQSIPSKKQKLKRIRIGNLPDCEALETKLKRYIAERLAVDIEAVNLKIMEENAVLCAKGGHDGIIAKLDHGLFEGKHISVQLEQPTRNTRSKKNRSQFGGSWTKPAEKNKAKTTSQSHKDPATTFSSGAVNAKNSNEVDFSSRQSNSLSTLMAEYGDFDPNWKQVVPRDSAPKSDNNTSRLLPYGKAPIHIELYSFGYAHGVPASCRSPISHAMPLPVFNCRNYIQVDPSQARLDGLSPGVKRFLLSAESPNVSELAVNVSKQTMEAIIDAVNDGHGFTDNLRMTVFIGSEWGRHRSVVAVEQAAVCLRNLLRENQADVSQPCSVGTLHRDISRRYNLTQHHFDQTAAGDEEDDEKW